MQQNATLNEWRSKKEHKWLLEATLEKRISNIFFDSLFAFLPGLLADHECLPNKFENNETRSTDYNNYAMPLWSRQRSSDSEMLVQHYESMLRSVLYYIWHFYGVRN